ncbi:MAG: 30S ribosomal protein S21 [Pelagibacteraceae bacterium]|nr:30S ribosomal protein S21 [Pelagibacteraceae bacterium]|tara:strand:+ start:341 stop:631 length:291 start_codon:yes stop_codon:yes gene_type:complete
MFLHFFKIVIEFYILIHILIKLIIYLNNKEKEKKIVQIFIRDNNLEIALKILKKKMQQEGLFKEMKLRRHYEKPSVKKKRVSSEVMRRKRKFQRKY